MLRAESQRVKAVCEQLSQRRRQSRRPQMMNRLRTKAILSLENRAEVAAVAGHITDFIARSRPTPVGSRPRIREAGC